MSAFLHPLALRHRPAWLLAPGALAIALHLLAGSVPVRPGAGGQERFIAEICTSHGVLNAAASPDPGDGSAPAGALHECCRSCATAGPLLVASSSVAVAPAPTFAEPLDAHDSVPPISGFWSARAPRGPPAQV